jgi:N-acetylneuraminic acid mutarotase
MSAPLFQGLFDKTITDIPATVDKQRYMTSVAPPAENQGRWVEQPRLPHPVGEMGVVECQGKIHVFGGYANHRVDGDYHQVFDPATGEWTLKAPFPHPCNHNSAAAIGGKIYTFGGFVEQNRCPHSKCFVYDVAATPGRRSRRSRGRAARSSPSFSTGRSTCSAVATCGRSSGTRSTIPQTDKYEDRGGMMGSTKTQPYAGQRDHMGVVVVDGKIHAIGGRMDSYDFNTGLHGVYDPQADSWSFRAPLPVPRSGPSAAYVGGRIVVFGGEATGKVFGTNEAYDPATDTWEALAPMRFRATACTARPSPSSATWSTCRAGAPSPAAASRAPTTTRSPSGDATRRPAGTFATNNLERQMQLASLSAACRPGNVRPRRVCDGHVKLPDGVSLNTRVDGRRARPGWCCRTRSGQMCPCGTARSTC